MFSSKNCPRCSGIIWVDRDGYGWYEQCLMCGFIRDLENIVAAGENSQDVPYQKKKISRSH